MQKCITALCMSSRLIVQVIHGTKKKHIHSSCATTFPLLERGGSTTSPLLSSHAINVEKFRLAGLHTIDFLGEGHEQLNNISHNSMHYHNMHYGMFARFKLKLGIVLIHIPEV